MGNLVKTPLSEVSSTLERLDCGGITADHFHRIRSDEAYARRVISALLDEPSKPLPVESVLDVNSSPSADEPGVQPTGFYLAYGTPEMVVVQPLSRRQCGWPLDVPECLDPDSTLVMDCGGQDGSPDISRFEAVPVPRHWTSYGIAIAQACCADDTGRTYEVWGERYWTSAFRMNLIPPEWAELGRGVAITTWRDARTQQLHSACFDTAHRSEDDKWRSGYVAHQRNITLPEVFIVRSKEPI